MMIQYLSKMQLPQPDITAPCTFRQVLILSIAKLVQQPYQDWYGSGGQLATTLKKMFNGDLIDVGDLGRLADLNIDGNGASYSGNGINVLGSNQSIERIRVTLTEGICLNITGGTKLRPG